MTPCLFLLPILVAFVAWGLSERRRVLGLPSSFALAGTSLASFAGTIGLAVALLA